MLESFCNSKCIHSQLESTANPQEDLFLYSYKSTKLNCTYIKNLVLEGNGLEQVRNNQKNYNKRIEIFFLRTKPGGE